MTEELLLGKYTGRGKDVGRCGDGKNMRTYH
jgi:hypothetical protein